MEYCGATTLLGLYDALAIDGILGIAPPYVGPSLKREGDYTENEWGMGYKPQRYATEVYQEQVYWPLASGAIGGRFAGLPLAIAGLV